MTPALRAVYDELLARASAPPFRRRADELRRAFAERTGGEVVAGAPELDARVSAGWDDALTAGGLAAEIGRGLADPSERALAALIARAHRGLFRLRLDAGRRIAEDLVSGAELLLIARDDVGRELSGPGPDSPLFDARLVGAVDGCAMLPGIVFHPADATPHIERVVAAALESELGEVEICDALLRMDHAFRTLSRVKVAYAYRPEALATRASR